MSGTEREVDLLASTQEAYEKAVLDAIFRDPLGLYFTQKLSTALPPTAAQRRRWRRQARWRRLKGWRLVLRNETDQWHKREDCNGW